MSRVVIGLLLAGVGKLRVTLVPGCSVSTPVSASSADGERAACLVGPGDTAIVDAVIPQHITVMGGSRITLPEVRLAQPACMRHQVSRWLRRL